MLKKKGVFVISLDFELYWGVRDKRALEDYKENLLGARSVIPSLLKLFDKYSIHATWAVVGFLFFSEKSELIKSLPVNKPGYLNKKLSPYEHIDGIGRNEKEDPYHYADSLIKMIIFYTGQEIGSHTFSHYYCLEKGQDIKTFAEDLDSAVKAAGRYDLTLKSLVFPRNQINEEYLDVCRKAGINACRGNQFSRIYKAGNEEDNSTLKRALRLLDAYVNISGYNGYSMEEIKKSVPLNIRASRYLRPYSERLKVFESLRLKRILSEMTHAAKKGLIYHLWWHPHNFGANTGKNMEFLEKILKHYNMLKDKYGMGSFNMGEVSSS
jgi:peptidoglycan/xylan/chitin deacetylase (PgdA/CDA1 family)